jgi:hypothetical protein
MGRDTLRKQGLSSPVASSPPAPREHERQHHPKPNEALLGSSQPRSDGVSLPLHPTHNFSSVQVYPAAAPVASATQHQPTGLPHGTEAIPIGAEEGSQEQEAHGAEAGGVGAQEPRACAAAAGSAARAGLAAGAVEDDGDTGQRAQPAGVERSDGVGDRPQAEGQAARRPRTPPAKDGRLLRVRQRVLKVASRLLVHSRRVILVIGQQAAGYWRALWHTLRSFDSAHVT